ncbi:MAG: DUF5030 domain-containing protein [Paraprevotella sp.]|nr:DUF5030 domain-containing protein [Paraprevotella sp.]
MEKINLLICMLGIIMMPWRVSAQKAFEFLWKDLDAKGIHYPQRMDKDAVFRYCFHSNRDNSMLRLFHLDTVPVPEMKERFYRTMNTPKRAPHFSQNDSVWPLMGKFILANSPLATCPVKKAQKMRGVWGFPFLTLKALLDKDGQEDTVFYQKIVDKFTPQKGTIRQGVPTWFEGNVVMLHDPHWYMDFVVSGTPWFFHYEKGRPTVIRHEWSYPDFFSFQAPFIVLDGSWVNKISAGMSFFANTINCDIIPGEAPSVSFTFLLHIKADYACDMELLLPREPGEDTKKAFKELRDYVIRLRPGLFKPLYTSDGRVFPGRYLQAWHDSRGWQIADILATTPNIPEGEYHLQWVK